MVVTSSNLTGVVEDGLGVEGSGLLGGVILGVRGDIWATRRLDVEADVVTGVIFVEVVWRQQC